MRNSLTIELDSFGEFLLQTLVHRLDAGRRGGAAHLSLVVSHGYLPASCPRRTESSQREGRTRSRYGGVKGHVTLLRSNWKPWRTVAEESCLQYPQIKTPTFSSLSSSETTREASRYSTTSLQQVTSLYTRHGIYTKCEALCVYVPLLTAVVYYGVFVYEWPAERHCFSWVSGQLCPNDLLSEITPPPPTHTQVREYKEKKKREIFHIDPSDPELREHTNTTTEK